MAETPKSAAEVQLRTWQRSEPPPSGKMLTTRSLADVAQALGVSKQAVSKAANSPTWTDPRW